MRGGDGLEDKPAIPMETRPARRNLCWNGGNRQQEAEGLTSNAWMITFADLCTLVLTFFVLLFSMSSLNEAAFRSTFQVPTGTGILGDFGASEPVRDACEIAVRQIRSDLEELDTAGIPGLRVIPMDEALSQDAMELVSSGKAIWVRRLPGTENFALVFGEQLLFESGKASLDSRVYPVLEVLAKFLTVGSYHCFIDGHTDRVPIRNRHFTNNEELSLARSLAVLYALNDKFKVNPQLLAAGAYGSSHPIAEEDTPEAKAINRRVEIIFHKVK